MRHQMKSLTIIQENHFQTQMVDITKLVRIGKYRAGFQKINKEFERSLIMQTGWRIRLQLLRRGIICLIKILEQYVRNNNKQESILQLLRKLQQFLQFYYEILENQAQEFKYFYLKDLLYRVSQIQALSFVLCKHHQDVRCLLFWKPQTYYKDIRFNKINFIHFLQIGHLHFQFKLFNQTNIYYVKAIAECESILGDIIKKDYHLKLLYPYYSRVLTWIVCILYCMSFSCELQSDYIKQLEILKLSKWFVNLTNNFELQKFIEEHYKQQLRQYYQYTLELKEINKILAPIFPSQNQKEKQEDLNDHWTKLNIGFYNKYNKETNPQLYSILKIPEEQTQNTKKVVRLTEQETTIQSYILTPRQQDKCRTFNSLDDVKNSKMINNNILPSPQHSHRTTVSQHIQSKAFKFTTDYDIFMKRFPPKRIEKFKSLNAKKELDTYYQDKVLSSFETDTQIRSLKSLKQQVVSQEEVDKICISDLVVGKKLLKFQKYTHQRVATDQNIMKLMSDISKEQDFLEGINSARLKLQGTHDIEQKIRVQMQQIIKQNSLHNDGELMNLKSLVSEYEQDLQKQKRSNEIVFEPSTISKNLRDKNTQMLHSIEQIPRRNVPDQVKNRKSFLTHIQEQLFKK